MNRIRRGGALLAACTTVAAGAAGSADAVIPPPWKNCSAVNARFPHGVGKVGARDHTSGGPVTNFKRSNALYALAMRYHRGLDRDQDGIACEQA